MAETPSATTSRAQEQQARERKTAEDVHDCESMSLAWVPETTSRVAPYLARCLKVGALSPRRRRARRVRRIVRRPQPISSRAHGHLASSSFWVLLGLGVFFVAMRGGPRGARAGAAHRIEGRPALGDARRRRAVRRRAGRAGARAGVQRRAQGERGRRRRAPQRRAAERPRTVLSLVRGLPHARGDQVGRSDRPEPGRARRRGHRHRRPGARRSC